MSNKKIDEWYKNILNSIETSIQEIIRNPDSKEKWHAQATSTLDHSIKEIGYILSKKYTR